MINLEILINKLKMIEVLSPIMYTCDTTNPPEKCKETKKRRRCEIGSSGVPFELFEPEPKKPPQSRREGTHSTINRLNPVLNLNISDV